MIKLKLDEAVKQTVAQMTLEEKVDQLNIGRPATYLGVENKRLGIPPIMCVDGPKGPHTSESEVCFPIALAYAATWDRELQREAGKEWAAQMKAFGKNQIYGPGVNMTLHPSAGRNSEYYGEDPVLSGKMAAAICEVLEKEDIIATLKHYAANDFETGRGVINVDVSERTLNELFLKSFKIGIQEGNATSVMTTYNQLNGRYTAANKALLEALYSWGFEGIVVSDWGANMYECGESLTLGHHIEICGWRFYSVENFKKALESGTITQEMLDQRVGEVLQLKSRKYDCSPVDVPTDMNARRKLAERIGADSITLLKNDQQVLPLHAENSLALIGPFADSDRIVGNQGSSGVHQEYAICVKDIVEKRVKGEFAYAKGCEAVDMHGEKRTAFPCKSSYFNNRDLSGDPVLVLEESSIERHTFDNKLELAEGVRGKAYDFYGAVSFMAGKFPKITSESTLTLSGWVFYKEQFADEKQPFLALQAENGHLAFTAGGLYGETPDGPVCIPYQIIPRTWAHLAYVISGGRAQVYINGSKISEMKAPSLAASEISLGGSAMRNAYSYSIIDEIHVYDRALNLKEITALKELNEPESGLIFHDSCETSPVISSVDFAKYLDINCFSARYEGKLRAEKTAKYYFELTTNGGARLFINGEMIFDQWHTGAIWGENRRTWISMTEGKEYDITVEFSSHGNPHLNFSYIILDTKERIQEAVQAAKGKDAAVVMVGFDQEYQQGEANDNENFDLPGYQDELIEAVAAVNPNTVVLLCTTGGCNMTKWINKVAGIMEVYYLGQEAGKAISSVLFGDVNPSGKLPVTYPVDLKQLDHGVVMTEYPDNLTFFGYRYFDQKKLDPRFAFGYGLSYTTFDYSNLEIKRSGDDVKVCFDLTNTGSYDGAETAQVYVTNQNTGEERPVKELIGFEKVFLTKGETKRVCITLTPVDFSVYENSTKQWKVFPGTYLLRVGASSRDLRLTGEITL